MRNLKKLGLYTVNAVEKFMNKESVETIDCIEGCLIDSFLLYDSETDLYYMCMEYAQNEWTSCYKVWCGNVNSISEKWDSFTVEVV